MIKKSKILFIVPLPPPVHGSSMMCNFIKGSEKINGSFDCNYINLSSSENIDEIGKQGIKKYLRVLNSLLKSIWKLITNKYEVCYLAITCHGIGFIKDAPFVLLCKLFCKKVILHQHNKGMSQDVNRPVFKWLLPLVYKNTKVILLSERLYPDISKVVKREQVEIIPNGIPEVPQYPKLTGPHMPRLLFLSNLIESKGVFVLLDACKILKDEGCLFQCDFVGGESKEINRERFEKEIEKRGLNEIIDYKGKIYGEEKNKIIAKSDILVFPTYYNNECFPLVLLEAMQQKTPVIATSEGGIEDIILNEETGLICKKQDPIDLAYKIITLLNEPEFSKKISDTAFYKFKNNYTLINWEEKIMDILNNRSI